MGFTDRLLDTVSEPVHAPDPAARPRLGVAVVTCMDPRVDPVRTLGMRPGDAHVLRNAGGLVTDDVVDTGLSAIFSDLLDATQAVCKPGALPLCTDNVGPHSTFSTSFPYLAAPK